MEVRGTPYREVTTPVVADFFVFLAEEKRLTPSSIKGYRAALAPVLRLYNLDISTSNELSNLIKNLEVNNPTTRSLVPRWDVTLVLRSLQQPPYEPLSQATLKSLTRKTAFLLALASAKRIGELHALSHIVSLKQDRSSATLSFLPEFVAKTQVPGRPETIPQPLVIPALSQILRPDDQDLLLCPVRALQEYTSRTQASRPRCRGLFISTGGTPKCISKNTLGHWLRHTIKDAYSAAPARLVEDCRITPHEIRAIATSLAFSRTQSLSTVMQAAAWRSHSTFTSHYLRDDSHLYLDLHSLGPVVAAQHLV